MRFSRVALTVGVTVSALALGVASHATVAVVNFDPPNTPQGPSTYVAAGPMQTITTTPATFTGGVVLGFATFFPAIAYASPSNVYGTADFGQNLGHSLDINITPGFTASEVSFALFNGETFAQTYEAIAYDGSTVVATKTIQNIPANFNSGYATVDLLAPNITKVVIAPTGAPSIFDFLIDTVAFNETVQQAVNNGPPPVTPPPPVFVPPPPVPVVDPNTEVEYELELNYGDSNNGLNTLHSIQNQPPPSTAPEAATWMMLVTGVGLAGSALRARARTTKA